MGDHVEYDEIAETVFAPIFPDIARAIIDRTGVVSGRLLDIGCGGGHLGLAVLHEGNFSSAVFADLSEEALTLADSRIKEQGFDDIAHTIQQDVCSLELPADSFDLIVSRGSMPFWEDQISAFSHLYNVLAPGGYGYVGGGLGGACHAKRIKDLNQRKGAKCRCFDRSKSKALSDDAYEELFASLGAMLRIISGDNEGHWIIFGKPVESE